MSGLTAAERAVVDEEEALCARVREALADARGRRRALSGGPTQAELEALRDSAAEADEDDAAPLLHELAVRHRVQGTGRAPLPDERAPYLAHLRLDEGGVLKDYLLGHQTFIDARRGVVVVDWRVAPVAQVFYRHREGEAFDEELPGRALLGTVAARRLVVFKGGQLVHIVTDAFALKRDAQGRWRSEARVDLAFDESGAGTAARPGALGLGVGKDAREGPADITALLDRQQFEAVSAPPERPLLVLGSAGSGKTTVALHRLARLSALEPERFPLEGSRVVVPSEGLARLSKRLLAPLLSADARVHTLDGAFRQLCRFALGRVPPLSEEPPALVTALKRHPALFDALRARPVGTSKARKAPSLKRLRAELAALLSDRTFLAEVVARAKGGLPTTVIEATVRHTMAQLAEPLSKLLEDVTDEERKQAVDGRPIEEGTPDAVAGTLDAEDLPLLLVLRGQRVRLLVPEAAHLVLDEAEDVSLAELDGLSALIRTSRTVTLAGDEAQVTQSSFAGWERSLATLGTTDAAVCRLETSYRCPRPVSELAQVVLGPLAPKRPAAAARDGAKVGRFAFPTEAQAWLFLAGALEDLLHHEPHASAAVIAHDEAAARRFATVLEGLPQARLVLDGSFTFAPGIDVTDVGSVKGLEFDYVVVPDASARDYPESDDARRRLHVAVTRAAHQLWLVSPGTPSPLVPWS